MPDQFSWLDTWPGAECKVSVQEQGSCGACYAFASTAMLAERLCINERRSGKDIEARLLSTQYLLSCDTLDFGCDGGHLPKTMDFLTTQAIPPAKC
jgi:cathepsin B